MGVQHRFQPQHPVSRPQPRNPFASGRSSGPTRLGYTDPRYQQRSHTAGRHPSSGGSVLSTSFGWTALILVAFYAMYSFLNTTGSVLVPSTPSSSSSLDKNSLLRPALAKTGSPVPPVSPPPPAAPGTSKSQPLPTGDATAASTTAKKKSAPKESSWSSQGLDPGAMTKNKEADQSDTGGQDSLDEAEEHRKDHRDHPDVTLPPAPTDDVDSFTNPDQEHGKTDGSSLGQEDVKEEGKAPKATATNPTDRTSAEANQDPKKNTDEKDKTLATKVTENGGHQDEVKDPDDHEGQDDKEVKKEPPGSSTNEANHPVVSGETIVSVDHPLGEGDLKENPLDYRIPPVVPDDVDSTDGQIDNGAVEETSTEDASSDQLGTNPDNLLVRAGEESTTEDESSDQLGTDPGRVMAQPEDTAGELASFDQDHSTTGPPTAKSFTPAKTTSLGLENATDLVTEFIQALLEQQNMTNRTTNVSHPTPGENKTDEMAAKPSLPENQGQPKARESSKEKEPQKQEQDSEKTDKKESAKSREESRSESPQNEKTKDKEKDKEKDKKKGKKKIEEKVKETKESNITDGSSNPREVDINQTHFVPEQLPILEKTKEGEQSEQKAPLHIPLSDNSTRMDTVTVKAFKNLSDFKVATAIKTINTTDVLPSAAGELRNATTLNGTAVEQTIRSTDVVKSSNTSMTEKSDKRPASSASRAKKESKMMNGKSANQTSQAAVNVSEQSKRNDQEKTSAVKPEKEVVAANASLTFENATANGVMQKDVLKNATSTKPKMIQANKTTKSPLVVQNKTENQRIASVTDSQAKSKKQQEPGKLKEKEEEKHGSLRKSASGDKENKVRKGSNNSEVQKSQSKR